MLVRSDIVKSWWQLVISGSAQWVVSVSMSNLLKGKRSVSGKAEKLWCLCLDPWLVITQPVSEPKGYNS